MSSSSHAQSLQPAVVSYYEAFELLLAKARNESGEHRTHFGLLEAEEVEEGYCLLATAANPHLYPRHHKAVVGAMDRLHERAFGELAPRRVLDVGFGAGGTLARFAADHPEAELHGININPMQRAIAAELLGDQAELHLGDFLSTPLPGRFDLLTFMESAFHIQDKERLAERIAEVLAPGGEVVIVDVFVPARVRRMLARRPGVQALFDYLEVGAWTELLRAQGVEVTDYDDVTAAVARHVTVSTPEEEARDRIYAPAAAGHPHPEAIVERLAAAWEDYRRLGQLLGRGLLRYGILRARKA